MLKNLQRLIMPLLMLLLYLFLAGGAKTVQADERILSFISEVMVHPNASLTVTETIKLRAEAKEIKFGIIRKFPTTYKDRFGNTTKVGFKVREVLRNGRTEPYHLESVSNGVNIYIGQKDVYLLPGVNTYTITYDTDRQLGFFQDFDELYWNVTGTGWTFPIDHAEAVVVLPEGAKILNYAAYTGAMGAKGQDFRVSYDGSGNIVFTTTSGLGRQEGLTIAVSWPKGIVYDASKEQHKQRIEDLKSGKLKITNIEDAKLIFNPSSDYRYTIGLPIDRRLKESDQYYIWSGTLSWKSGNTYYLLDNVMGNIKCFGFTNVIGSFNEMLENSRVTVVGKLLGENEVTLVNKVSGVKENKRVPILTNCYVF